MRRCKWQTSNFVPSYGQLNCTHKRFCNEKFLFTAALLTTVSSGTITQAQETGGWYGGLFGGLSRGTYDTSNSLHDVEILAEMDYSIGATLGKNMTPDIRVEAELSYSDYEFDSITVGSTSIDADGGMSLTYLMGNAWYDLPPIAADDKMMPYVGGGLGVAIVHDVERSGVIFNTANALAFQIGGGFQFPAGTGTIDVGYRYKRTTSFEPETDEAILLSGNDVSVGSHTLQLGYIVDF